MTIRHRRRLNYDLALFVPAPPSTGQIWVADGGASGFGFSGSLYDPRLLTVRVFDTATPTLITSIDLTAYAPPFPFWGTIRMLRLTADGLYVLACMHTYPVPSFHAAPWEPGKVLVINALTYAVEGVALLSATAGGFTTVMGARDCVDSQDGNFWVIQSSGGNTASSVEKFNMEAVLVNGPGTPTASVQQAVVSDHAEELCFGAGYIWTAGGTYSKTISRINPNAAGDAYFLWVVDKSTTQLTKVNGTNPSAPSLVTQINFSAYGTGGRTVSVNGNYVFVGMFDTAAPSQFIIVDSTTNAIVGAADIGTAGIGTAPRGHSFTFDGLGNVFCVVSNNSSVLGSVYKYDIASIVAAFPAVYSTPIAVFATGRHIENLSFGAGYLWASEGQNIFPSRFRRIDPVTGTEVFYTDGTAYWGCHFAFGSAWATRMGAGQLVRFDPATFPAAPIATVTTSPFHGVAEITSDATTIWAACGSNFSSFEPNVVRFSTGLGTEAQIAIVTAAGVSNTSQGIAVDGGNAAWATLRRNAGIGLASFSVGLGTEAFLQTFNPGGIFADPVYVAIQHVVQPVVETYTYTGPDLSGPAQRHFFFGPSFFFGALWAGDNSGYAIYRFNPAEFGSTDITAPGFLTDVVLTGATGSVENGFASDGTNLWASDAFGVGGTGTHWYKIDPTGGSASILVTVTVVDAGYGVESNGTFDGTNIWWARHYQTNPTESGFMKLNPAGDHEAVLSPLISRADGSTGTGGIAGGLFQGARSVLHVVPPPAPPYDPSLLPLTLWLRAGYYNGVTWIGTPSAGTSGSHSLPALLGQVPEFGPAFNGHLSVKFNNTDHVPPPGTPTQINAQRFESGLPLSDFITDTQWSFWALINVTSILYDNLPNTVYGNGALIGDDGGYWGLYFKRREPIAQMYQYDSFAIPQVAGETFDDGTLVLIQGRYDGTNIQLRLGSSRWVLEESAAIQFVTGLLVVSVSGFYDGLAVEIGLSQALFSDATFDGIAAYLNYRYGYVETFPAHFNSTNTIAFVGSKVWFAGHGDDGGNYGQYPYVQGVNPALPTPKVTARAHLLDYALHGGGNFASSVAIREVREAGGYLCACVRGIASVPSHGTYLVMIDPATNNPVGNIKYASANFMQARSVTSDGTNIYVGVNETGGSPIAKVHKYAIADVLAAYPADPTPVWSANLTTHIEELAFGAGAVWVTAGDFNGDPGVLKRIDATTAAVTSYTLTGGFSTWKMWGIYFAFGSVWVGAAPNLSTTAPILRFNPATFPSAPIANVDVGLGMSENGGMNFTSDGTYLWFTSYQSGQNVWRIDPTLGAEIVIATVNVPISSSLGDMCFDGTSIWVTSRYAADAGLTQISTGLGTEAVVFRLVENA